MIIKGPDDRQKQLPSIPLVASPSLGVIPLVHPRGRVQARQAAHGDHPLLLQLLEMWKVILLPPRILTRVKKVDLQLGEILQLTSEIVIYKPNTMCSRRVACTVCTVLHCLQLLFWLLNNNFSNILRQPLASKLNVLRSKITANCK